MRQLRHFELVETLKINGVIVALIVLLFNVFNTIFKVDRRAVTFITIIVPLTESLNCSSVANIYVICLTTRINFTNTVLGPFAVKVTRSVSKLPLFSKVRCEAFY